MGRVSSTIHVKEMSIPVCNQLLQKLNFRHSAYERLKILSVTGGIPRYLEELQANHPDTAVIMATAVGDVNIAVDAMRKGALDYLTKPFNVNDLIISVARVLEMQRLILENRNYQLSLERQLTALNNLFQAHLRLREDVEEVYNRLAVNLAKLSEEIQSLAKEVEAERERIQIPPAERPKHVQ